MRAGGLWAAHAGPAAGGTRGRAGARALGCRDSIRKCAGWRTDGTARSRISRDEWSKELETKKGELQAIANSSILCTYTPLDSGTFPGPARRR